MCGKNHSPKLYIVCVRKNISFHFYSYFPLCWETAESENSGEHKQKWKKVVGANTGIFQPFSSFVHFFSIFQHHLHILSCVYETNKLMTHELGDGEPVVRLDLVKQRQGVVLHHLVLRRNGLLYLVNPSPNNLENDNNKNDYLGSITHFPLIWWKMTGIWRKFTLDANVKERYKRGCSLIYRHIIMATSSGLRYLVTDAICKHTSRLRLCMCCTATMFSPSYIDSQKYLGADLVEKDAWHQPWARNHSVSVHDRLFHVPVETTHKKKEQKPRRHPFQKHPSPPEVCGDGRIATVCLSKHVLFFIFHQEK